ncbi:MAG TPA: DUF4349 domain-containing protein [SAR202 cluster bacterium]|jgi:hypothetical protein|nr:DUF4349 domain-containing protein [SAR202 cluster bacterium]MDP7413220.1 DUF4349 domain-containing protein [SAR202 cluster bacterium]HJO82452.1 DUF4349 domain-containing protein [SAR202 cluster bacterium]
MIRDMKLGTLSVLMLSVIAIGLVACDSKSSDFDEMSMATSEDSAAEAFRGYAAPAAGAAAAPAPSAPAPAPAPAFAPAPPMAPAKQSFGETVSGPPGLPGMPGNPGALGFQQSEDSSANSTASSAQLASQRRIIIRTVDMTIIVPDVAASLEDISALAKSFDGWVVSSDRTLTHRGFISIRVPSDDLDAAIIALRGMAEKVDSEISTSQDVTDEYVDLQSRLVNQQATEGALLKLLDRAETVEAALSVQRELTRVQQEIERIQGRVKFLEETSAFSLLNVRLELAPLEMEVDAGIDKTVSIRENTRLRATFEPPEGIDEFSFTWDFGDGSEPTRSTRTAPTSDEDKRVTATFNHAYFNVEDSPYIVEIEMEGFGDAGIAEGSDTLIVQVTELPVIEVFAGENIVREQGEEVEFSASFTHPEGLTEVAYKWDFGDGTSPDTGSVTEGSTRVDAVHVYQDFRPFAYKPTLTITAEAEAGEIKSEGSLSVLIVERPAWTVSGWNAGDSGRTAVRALSVVGIGLQTGAIWAAIFSPVWVIVLVATILVRRQMRRRRSARPDAGGFQPYSDQDDQ